jgi:hypothetical protein
MFYVHATFVSSHSGYELSRKGLDHKGSYRPRARARPRARKSVWLTTSLGAITTPQTPKF